MPQRLPRFYLRQQQIEDEQKLARILLEGGDLPANGNGKLLRASADGHNRDRRRGLPVISKGISGTQPGSDPVAELLKKEARGELRNR